MRFLICWFGTILSCIGHVHATVYMTVPEALKKTFGNEASIEEKRAFLTDAQVDAVTKKLTSDRLESALVTYYRAQKSGGVLGTAYLDTHLVRTMAETLMVAISPKGKVIAVEILSFDEPKDYSPSKAWLKQFNQLDLKDDIRVQGKIHGITGATLTSRSITKAVARCLATHAVLFPSEASK